MNVYLADTNTPVMEGHVKVDRHNAKGEVLESYHVRPKATCKSCYGRGWVHTMQHNTYRACDCVGFRIERFESTLPRHTS